MDSVFVLKNIFNNATKQQENGEQHPCKVYNVYALCLKADRVLVIITNSYVYLITTQISIDTVDLFVILIIGQNKSLKVIKIVCVIE